MACNRCGAKSPVRQSSMPSAIRSGTNRVTVANPPRVPGSSQHPRDVISGLRYVPGK